MLSGTSNAANQNLHGDISTKAQARTSYLNESGTARLKHLEPAAASDTKFSKTGDPREIARHLHDLPPVTRLQQLQERHGFLRRHRTPYGRTTSVRAMLPVFDAPPITQSRSSEAVTMRWTYRGCFRVPEASQAFLSADNR